MVSLDCDLNSLYSVQTLDARLITGPKKYDHILVLERLIADEEED